jgi:hypothetical protein
VFGKGFYEQMMTNLHLQLNSANELKKQRESECLFKAIRARLVSVMNFESTKEMD